MITVKCKGWTWYVTRKTVRFVHKGTNEIIDFFVHKGDYNEGLRILRETYTEVYNEFIRIQEDGKYLRVF